MRSTKNDTATTGLLRHLFVNGVLLFGIPTAVIMTVVRFQLGSTPFDEYISAEWMWTGVILQALIVGLAFGSITWFLGRRNTKV